MQELTVTDNSTSSSRRQNSAESAAAPAVLHRALDSLWEQLLPRLKESPREGFGELERELRDKFLRLAAHMLGEAVACSLGTGRQGNGLTCPECGSRAKFIGNRPRTITTAVREIRIKRAYYHCPTCGHGEFPLDRMLSLNGTSFSPWVREAICLLNADVPFQRGGELLEHLSAVRLDKQEGRSLAEGLGRELERQTLEEIENVWRPNAPIPRESTEPAKRLYLSPDGTTVPMLKGFKEVKVGAVFTATIPKRGSKPQREKTRYVGTTGNAQDLGRRLYVEALKMGLSDQTEVVTIADGAHWIWNEVEATLPKNRVEIIDFYHASEKLWEVSRAIFGEENPKGKQWAERWSRRLHKSDGRTALGALRRLKPKSGEAKETVRKVIHYFQGNRKRMRYREFRMKGYFIGSGVVESCCKHLVGSRLKQAGMRWTPDGAQAILQLRLAVLNKRWDYLWKPGAAVCA